ncbi:MAG: alpha/beta hydrolase [Candidatus Saccharibacteria bacterium]|nr:alpha/beta hydrolase [Moraxellaceae bacterium]
MVFIQLLPDVATQFALVSERARAGLTKHSIQLDDGLTYVYLEGGSGEPLLLLHGFNANKDNFTRIAGKLTPKYHVIIPDHIGFGESSHPANADYRSDAQAQRLHQLLSKLNIKQVHIGGNSMGGAISVAYAARYGSEVESAWLLDSGGVSSAPKTPMFDAFDNSGKFALIARTPEEYERVYKLAMNNPPFVPKSMLRIFAKESIANADLEDLIIKQLRFDSIEERAKLIKAPTLIVWGDKDQILNIEGAAILHKLIPQSYVVIMPNIGHLPMLEDVGQTAKDYLEFRASIKK